MIGCSNGLLEVRRYPSDVMSIRKTLLRNTDDFFRIHSSTEARGRELLYVRMRRESWYVIRVADEIVQGSTACSRI